MVLHRLRIFSTPLFVDDASMSSTVSVDRETKKELSTSSGKRVTFNMPLNEMHDNEVICKEDCLNLWYLSSDYKNFKRSTYSAAKAIIQAESSNFAPSSYQRVLEHTHQLCRKAVSEYDEYQNLSTADDRRHLNRWAEEVAPCRVGMETWAVRCLARSKSMRRIEIVDIVLLIQDAAHGKKQTDTQEVTRKNCESISRPSRLFAVTLAQAQAAALLKEESKEGLLACRRVSSWKHFFGARKAR
jgi:hypothetical protein